MRRSVFAGTRVLLPDGLAAAQVCVENGRIVAIDALGSALPRGAVIVELRNHVLLPGLVDTHVHINEPGRTHWEGFVSATRAAAAGGVTTLLDMPLNCVPATTTAAALAAKRASAAGQLYVDVGFIGGVVPGNTADLKGLYDEGVFAWKCFLSDSGVDEFPRIDLSSLRPVLARIVEWQLPLMVHAEIPELLVPATTGVVRRYADYAATRPAGAELAAVQRMAELSASSGAPVHIVHVSSAEGVDAITTARARAVAITGETCPHYLTFAAEEIPDAATEFKCAPPIRSGAQREALWGALVNGQLSMVVSDHSPAPPALKHRENGDLTAAWGGIASLELGLAALWAGAERRGIAFSDIVGWMSARPAELVRLPRKGRIAVGCDADLVIWHPEARRRVDASKLRQRHPMTPYHGLTLAGEVQATYLRGQLVYEQGVFAPTAGRLLHRAHG